LRIEILYFDGCPHSGQAYDRVLEVLREEGVSGEIVKVNVTDNTIAQAVGFLGSPSIRINGLDVEPDARSSKAFGMMCRTYSDASARVGLPSRELIRKAVREAAGEKDVGCA
jgi:hypothetical protein